MKLKQVQGTPNFFINTDSGIFYVRRMVNGTRRDISTGQRSLKAAQRRYREIMGELDSGKAGWNPKDVPDLGQWWAAYRQAKKKSERTWHREEEIMSLHVLPFFGRLALNEITQSQMERLLNGLRRRGKAEGTVIRIQSLLHAVFNAAIDDDLIVKNPLRKIPRGRYATRQRVLSFDDQKKMSETLSLMLNRWMLFMLGTGLRLDEARGIRPSRDIDWAKPSIHVLGKGHNGEPKEREVPILDLYLVELIETQLLENALLTSRHRMDRSDTLWAQKQSYFRKELTKACKEAGVDYFSPHTLRHSFATRYLQAGGNIYSLSKILGHYSVEVTERVYAHLAVEDHAKLSKHVNLGLKPITKVIEAQHRFG